MQRADVSGLEARLGEARQLARESRVPGADRPVAETSMSCSLMSGCLRFLASRSPEEARARLPALKIIFATGDHAAAHDFGKLDAVLLGKPYTPEDLREAVSAVASIERAGGTGLVPRKGGG